MIDAQKTFDRCRTELLELLKDLAKDDNIFSSQNKVDETYYRLCSIYRVNDNATEFRHYYSDIFTVLSEIKQLESSVQAIYDPSSVETVGANIRYLYDNYQGFKQRHPEASDIEKSLHKLYDHVSLDIARINYIHAAIWQESINVGVYDLEEKVTKLDETYEKINGDFRKQIEKAEYDVKQLTEKTEEGYKGFNKRLQESQKDYIAILGIFASIVLAFVGGLAFSTSVFNNIASVSAYKLLIVALVVGLVFTTIIYLLFYYVGILTDKYSSDKKPIKPLWLAYIVIGALMLTVVVAWYVGVVEQRNTRIDDDLKDHQQVTDTLDLPVDSNVADTAGTADESDIAN